MPYYLNCGKKRRYISIIFDSNVVIIIQSSASRGSPFSDGMRKSSSASARSRSSSPISDMRSPTPHRHFHSISPGQYNVHVNYFCNLDATTSTLPEHEGKTLLSSSTLYDN